MASRNLDDLTPACREAYERFAAAMERAGLPFLVTCTARSVREQVALYAQGRSPEHVNPCAAWPAWPHHLPRKPEQGDLDPGLEAPGRPGPTQPATTRAGPSTSPSSDHEATTLHPLRIKADVNQNASPTTTRPAHRGSSGLRWGGRFARPDRCHFW